LTNQLRLVNHMKDLNKNILKMDKMIRTTIVRGTVPHTPVANKLFIVS
jgi:hypothetical protein